MACKLLKCAVAKGKIMNTSAYTNCPTAHLPVIGVPTLQIILFDIIGIYCDDTGKF
jgi:hypothetical protein